MLSAGLCELPQSVDVKSLQISLDVNKFFVFNKLLCNELKTHRRIFVNYVNFESGQGP